MSSNPFSQKAGLQKHKNSTSGPAQKSNPFSLAARGSQISSQPARKKIKKKAPTSSLKRRSPKSRVLRSVRSSVDTSMLSIGTQVRLKWKIDPAYGSGTGVFTGTIRGINDWITVVDNQGVKFHYPIATLTSVEPV